MKIQRILVLTAMLASLLFGFQLAPVRAYDLPVLPLVPNPWPDSSLAGPQPALPSTAQSYTAPACHFGIGIVNGTAGYDVTRMGFGTYVTWGYQRYGALGESLDLLPILRTSNQYFQTQLNALPSIVAANPGATWIIGNEPDSEVYYQDHISAEVYAERYYAMATKIRQLDPTASLGFGSIIHPTAIRRYYLDLALNRLDQLTGSREATLGLIDVYTIHSFLINEQRIYDPVTKQQVSWGSGVPVGYDEATWPAPERIIIEGPIDETWKTHSIELYKERIIAFRQWMKDHGEQDKPLWVTEYGSLLPPVDIGFIVVSDQDTANFMTDSFDFMLGYKDPNLGYAGDDNRLVQNWVWWSLNEYRNRNGGSLYDPVTKQLTLVGERYLQYDPPRSAVPLLPNDAKVSAKRIEATPYSLSDDRTLVDYRVSVDVSNTVSTEYLTRVQVELYDGDQLVGTAPMTLPRCSGLGEAVFILKNQHPGTQHAFRVKAALLPEFGDDTDPTNNDVTFAPVTFKAIPITYLPLTGRSLGH